MTRRVVVTGVGLVSPVGIGTQANWEALCAGQGGIGPITHFDASEFSARIAGEVKGFDPLRFVEKRDVKKMDVFIQYALAAAEFAVCDADLKDHTRDVVSRRRVHRVRYRWVYDHRAGTQSADRGRSAAHFTVFHSVGHHQSGRRSGIDSIWRARAQFGDVHGVRRLGARDRRCIRDHSTRATRMP